MDSDAANMFIPLTARALNPDLRIVARASEQASIGKLVRAGADEVVSPYGLTGRRMAAVLAVQPSVLEVLDLLNLGSDIRLEGGRRPGRDAPGQPDDRRGPRTLRRGGHPRAEKTGKQGLSEPAL